uniref:Uncharacterized protein n=1 Tax=Oryza brachyantha TaxID=4533 RepID=J3M1L9_ORYBR
MVFHWVQQTSRFRGLARARREGEILIRQPWEEEEEEEEEEEVKKRGTQVEENVERGRRSYCRGVLRGCNRIYGEGVV